jgi:hypothetical protein
VTRAARTLSVTGAIVVLGGIGLSLTDSADGSGRPIRGSLAPLDSSRVEGWTELARFTPEELTSGRIRALDVVADSVFVLQSHAWSLVVGGQLQGTYGTALAGAPEYLARAEGIARTTEGVAVLDAPRQRITMWSAAGERLADREIVQAEGRVQLHQALTPSAAGPLLTSWVSTDSGGQWLVQRFRDNRVDTLPAAPRQRIGESFNLPLLLPRADSTLLVVEAETWRIRQLSPTLAPMDSAVREAPPRFRVPTSVARRLRETTARIPEAQRRDFLLSESLPSVRTATITDNGELLVLTIFDEEATVAELVGVDGRAIASLWTRPDSNAIFAVRGSLIRVRELSDVTIIERLRLQPND